MASSRRTDVWTGKKGKRETFSSPTYGHCLTFDSSIFLMCRYLELKGTIPIVLSSSSRPPQSSSCCLANSEMGRTKSTPKRGREASQVLVGNSGHGVDDEEYYLNSSLPPIEILEEEEARASSRPDDISHPSVVAATQRAKKSPSKRKRLVRKVTFCETTNVIPEPEVELCVEDKTITIRSSGQTQSVKQKLAILKSWSLENWSMIRAGAEGGDDALVEVPVRTKFGVERILNQVMREHLTHDKAQLDVISQPISDGLFQFHLSTSEEAVGSLTVSISVVLDKAYHECNPQFLPVGTLNRKRGPGVALNKAMSVLYPDFSTQTHAIDSISAAQIYAAVDNVQFNARKGNVRKDLERIPGLVPTLRPYQQAAVQWMLERELDECIDQEWELSWLYLKNGSFIPLADGRVDDFEALYCPAMGWLCSSYEEAKLYSVGEKTTPGGRGGICADSMGLGKTVYSEESSCIVEFRNTHGITPCRNSTISSTAFELGRLHRNIRPPNTWNVHLWEHDNNQRKRRYCYMCWLFRTNACMLCLFRGGEAKQACMEAHHIQVPALQQDIRMSRMSKRALSLLYDRRVSEIKAVYQGYFDYNASSYPKPMAA